jgi:hypothetical protein
MKLKQPLAAGCLRTRAPVRQAPCRCTVPPRPIQAWGRPRQPAVPRPGHAPSSRTPNPARAACRPALAPPRTTQARHTTWHGHGRRPRLGGFSRQPYLVPIVSQAQCQKSQVHKPPCPVLWTSPPSSAWPPRPFAPLADFAVPLLFP